MVNLSPDALDAVFSALAHPARRGMLERLATGAASVGELAVPYRMSAPAISKHVRVLERAGLVSRERDGRVHRLDLSGSSLTEALHWLDRHHRFWTVRLDALAALLEAPEPQKEEHAWPTPPPAPSSRSRSSARSRRRRNASSKRSRRHRN
jgi:DNA-binding transcriptional ArsR family regulator